MQYVIIRLVIDMQALLKLMQRNFLFEYRIAGNFGRSKLWRMVLNLRFGEFNFGGLS